ncbi:unnamed protein product [Miscanthus lutarioriparius]|uniref:Uncharacterized protein n=1 Tax=Miscanthus lutarioriparius TaxID=422564 RepID=A0A811NM24_9POAL|nr:unnamed protein product [Miscanthus lutarioriparius]
MAKNRNKKNKAKKSGGVAAMDISEGGPATSTATDAPQPMDTSDGKQPSSATAVLGSINKNAVAAARASVLTGLLAVVSGGHTHLRPMRHFSTMGVEWHAIRL